MARLRYKGGGFIPKVPSRDLSAEEAHKFGIERLIKSGLYEDLYPPERFKPVVEEEPEPVEELDEGDHIEEG